MKEGEIADEYVFFLTRHAISKAIVLFKPCKIRSYNKLIVEFYVEADEKGDSGDVPTTVHVSPTVDIRNDNIWNDNDD